MTTAPRLVYTLIVLFLMQSCANRVSLTGGVKDEVPPKLLVATPNNGATDFKEKIISLTFDEIIQLRNPSQILVSPLLNDPIKYQTSGKSLSVKLPECLMDSTTYTIHFNEALVDNNEGNPLKDFTFKFSTYNVLDTLYMNGLCIDAKNKEPIGDALIGLYLKSEFMVDSLKPNYISKTKEDGSFTITGLRKGKYYIRAIKDDNKDYKLQRTEMFGFKPEPFKLDSFVDSISIEMSNDKAIKVIYDVNANDFTGSIIALSKPCETFEIKGFNNGKIPFSLNFSKDTIFLNEDIRDTSLLISINNDEFDTLYVSEIVKSDNKVSLTPKIISEKIKGSKVSITLNLRLDSFDSKKIHLFKDSSEIAIDSITTGIRNVVHVFFKRPVGVNGINLIVDSATFYSGKVTHDSYNSPLALISTKELGTIEFDITTAVGENLIVYLLDSKGGIVQQKRLIDIKQLIFSGLYSGEYKLKVIKDKNCNGIWDSIDFNEMKAAEEIKFFGPYRLEKGWDLLGNEIAL